MAIVSCTSCGAQIEDTSRFCRVCGRSFDPSELTTRRLEPGVEFHAPTQPVNQSTTAPAYLSPVQVPAVPATNDLAPVSQNRTAIVLLAATVGLLLFLLGALAYVSFRSGGPPDGPPGIGTPGIGSPPPDPPGMPPPPPPPGVTAPPIAPPAAGDAVIGEELIYPGAERLMTINRPQGKGVLHLKTNDAARKVVEWYTAKLKPTESAKLPFGNAILRAGDITVVITGTEDGTTILISGDDGEAPPPPPR